MMKAKAVDSSSSEAVSDNGQDKSKGEFFKNRQAALQWLQQRGQVSRSKFYDDCNAGRLTVHPDKTLSKFEVACYAEKLFAATRQAAAGSGALSMQREADEARKIRAEAEIKEMQAEEMRRELDNKWLYRDTALLDLAVILTSIQQALDYHSNVAAAAIIQLAGGDPSRSFDVSEGIKELVLEAGFNDVANAGTLRVKFKGESDSDEDFNR